MRGLLGAILALTLAAPALAAEAPPLAVVSQGPATAARGVQFVLHSERVGRDYVVTITQPFTPPMLPGQRAAAIYTLDGGYDLVGSAGFILGGSGTMEGAYIVAISYPPGPPATRERDFLFREGTRPNGTVAKGGGGTAFLAFLTEELQPFMAQRYKADPARSVLFGHSLGGIFAANVLAEHPEAFGGYLIASPSVWADPSIVERLGKARRKGLTKRVFVAYGGAEADYMVSGGAQVAAAVGSAPTYFLTRSQVFEGEGHLSYYPAIPNAAFPFLLPRNPPMVRPDEVAIEPARLGRYLGSYKLSDGRIVEVKRENDRLFLQVPGALRQRLAGEASDRFFVDGVDLRAIFEGGDAKAAGKLVLTVNGDTAEAPRQP